MDTEVILELANGRTLRSASGDFMAGDYVRLCDNNGDEMIYWHHDEWADDPALVMGAILMAAGANLRNVDDERKAAHEQAMRDLEG